MKTRLSILIAFFVIITSFAQDKKWTLKECVDYALEHNITIKQNEYDISLSEINKKDAFGNMLPNLNINGNHSWNSGLTQDVTTGVLRNQTTQNTSFGLSAGVTIYSGLQSLNRLRKSDLAILASRYQVDKIKDDISLNVINSFLRVLFDKETLKVAEPQLEISKKQLERTQALVDAGTLPKGDLLDIQATLANDEQSVVVAENNLKISLLSLAQLLQLDDIYNFDVADSSISNIPLTKITNNSVEEIFQKAVQNRSEIKLAKTNIEISEKDIIIAKGALLPTLSGFYNWNSRASNAERIAGVVIDSNNPTNIIGTVEGSGENVITDNFTPVLGAADNYFNQIDLNKGSSFGLQLQIPVFNGFRTKNSIKKSKINLEKSKLQLEQQEIDLERTINTVYNDAAGSLKVLEAAQKSVASQEEAFRYSQEKFNVGAMNSFDFSQTQNRLVKARSDVIRAKFDYLFKIKLLEFYYGIPIVVE